MVLSYEIEMLIAVETAPAARLDELAGAPMRCERIRREPQRGPPMVSSSLFPEKTNCTHNRDRQPQRGNDRIEK